MTDLVTDFVTDRMTDTAPTDDLDGLKAEALREVEAAPDLAALEALRVSYLGKKGSISARMKGLGRMSPQERQTMGPALNGLKVQVGEAVEARRAMLERDAMTARLAAEAIDVTLPVRTGPTTDGRIHPISQVMEEIVTICADLGFSLAQGPDIETDWYNFGALNIPADHPAREMQDTFYLPEKPDGSRMVLRTQTSPVQIRSMEAAMKAGGPPIRVVCPGRTYRSDSDQTHTPMFHQLEGLCIGTDIHMGHLKWTLEAFCKAFFEVDRVAMRYRASHFPFTEPSMEVDIQCDRSGGRVAIGEGSDWLEILGCGMVHPAVLRNGGIDPMRYQGFAWGMGIDRLAMLKYGAPDLRAFFHSDLRWLRHYGFRALDVPSLAGGLSA